MTNFEKDVLEIAESLRRQREDLADHMADRTSTHGETAEILRKIGSLKERLERTAEVLPPTPAPSK